jgi:hypothetical protein
MQNFGIMLKSYLPDIDYTKRFIESFIKYATETIPLYVVVPDSDVPAFEDIVGSLGEVLPESLWSEHLVDYRIHGNSAGYINQEIIKLAFAEKNLIENYLCADSEAVFIRPFSKSDFMADATTPFTFVTEDHELQVDPIYYERYGSSRQRSLVRLRRFLGLPEDRFETCHGLAVFSSDVLASLRGFMEEEQFTYADLLEISPYEFSWYNFWLEKTEVRPRIKREPIFETIHMSHQHLGYALKGIGLPDLARGYVGVVVNSGHSRDQGVLDFETDFVDILSQNLGYGQIVGAITEKALQRAPRVRKIFKV